MGYLSERAARYLRTTSCARPQQSTGGWVQWTPEQWEKREAETLGALKAIRKAMEVQSHGG